ncbi:MAG: hypothetical protein VX563_04520 [Planctomycetota bacterium]|nr:hypothetical protein [Planctomycetota bacterium]
MSMNITPRPMYSTGSREMSTACFLSSTCTCTSAIDGGAASPSAPAAADGDGTAASPASAPSRSRQCATTRSPDAGSLH